VAPKKVLIIGGVTAGPKAAARARRVDPDLEITILEQGEYLSFGACGLPYYIGGITQRIEELTQTPVGIVRDSDFFRRVKGTTVHTRTRAEAIDRHKKEVRAVNLETGETAFFPYDKLVIATGSSPVRLPIPGADLPNVFHVWTIKDAVAIRERLEAGDVKDVVVIGAGLIGLEVAESMAKAKGLPGEPPRVTVIEAMAHITPNLLDPEIAALVTKTLRLNQLEVRTGEMVRRIEETPEGRMMVTTDKGTLAADLVIVAIGARPNVSLAKDADLEIGVTGGIKVNDRMQTSDPDIYAGGDCVENINIITGQPIYTPLGSVANKHGRVIGTNVAGGRETFPGVLGTAIYKVFDFAVARTGLTEKQARDFGYPVESVIVVGGDRAHFYPGSRAVHIKLIVDKNTRRILGTQIVGPGNCDKRLDVVVTAISMGATVDQLAGFDLGYSPPYNTAMDVLHHAANTMRNKLDGLAQTLAPAEVKKMMDQGRDFVLVDVRTNREFSNIPPLRDKVSFMPLAKVREMHEKLPKDKPIVVYCAVSMRAWDAQRILNGLGFKDVRFLEGGLAAWPY